MVKIIRLTEADLTILIKKIVNEQERIDDPSDKYFMEIDYIANYAIDEAMEPEDIEAAIDEISDIMGEADSDEDLSDDELDAMKQKRFDDWVAIITAPPVEPIEE